MGKRLIPPEPAEIHEVMLRDALEERYLAYALSTIMHRALPDARDGLKPVHRRILYGMRLLRLDPGTPFKKSAKIVGDVMGSFHPHGDQSIYDALVRLAQDFAARYPLIEGQGNSIRYHAEVAQITTRNGKATGVRLASGETIPADIVVSNADSAFTYTKLLSETRRLRWSENGDWYRHMAAIGYACRNSSIRPYLTATPSRNTSQTFLAGRAPSSRQPVPCVFAPAQAQVLSEGAAPYRRLQVDPYVRRAPSCPDCFSVSTAALLLAPPKCR